MIPLGCFRWLYLHIQTFFRNRLQENINILSLKSQYRKIHILVPNYRVVR